ncbi:peptide chain release factor 1 [Patescibacteria group bacterium]|nr:peptide chain release factor 1 [Patescibacteria group bacterium]
MKNLLTKYEAKYKELEVSLQDRAIISDSQKLQTISQEYSEVKNIYEKVKEYIDTKNNLKQLKKDIEIESEEEMKTMMEEEIISLETNINNLKETIDELTKPQDPLNKKNAIMEIRAGTGGDESALFAANLFRMYSRYAEKNNWKISILSSNRTELSGFKEIIFEIAGTNVYGKLKYESGVHRVQRVPETEKSGRIHTSAATVAVLPEAEEVDLKIEPSDIRIDTYCASGHGGQSVNTTYSAVRIVHLPTNIVATCQDEKSQQQNKIKAMQVLRSRILQQIEDEKRAKDSAARKSQIGTGDRSEKIRTYNWPQDRVTDHRIKLSLHNLDNILDGDIDEIINALIKAENELNQ